MTAISPETRRAALFAGSFNPFTAGHASLVERALPLFDHIYIAVGRNAAKAAADSNDSRISDIAALYAAEPRVSVVDGAGCLTARLAASLGCRWLLRGVRSARDFEYERDMADINRRISGLETVLLFTLPELAAVSSSVVRELASYGCDTSQFLPQPSTMTEQ